MFVLAGGAHFSKKMQNYDKKAKNEAKKWPASPYCVLKFWAHGRDTAQNMIFEKNHGALKFDFGVHGRDTAQNMIFEKNHGALNSDFWAHGRDTAQNIIF